MWPSNGAENQANVFNEVYEGGRFRRMIWSITQISEAAIHYVLHNF